MNCDIMTLKLNRFYFTLCTCIHTQYLHFCGVDRKGIPPT